MRNMIRKIKNKKLIPLIISSIFLILYFVLPYSFLTICSGSMETTINIGEGGNSCGYVSFNKEKFWCGGHCYSVAPNNINNDYEISFEIVNNGSQAT